MTASTITSTQNPIHFEDLEPRRFEDLVRELIYDFRDWYKIEATGRSGSDDGFDIRAFERMPSEVSVIADQEESIPSAGGEGNLWMIQCKREKTISPSKLRKYLDEIDRENPPHGYILAAACDFSKRSYDLFREFLCKVGVQEFQLWGRAELESMLLQPKNDRILFTFFRISLLSRRRSRTTEIRARVINKNRLFDLLPRDSTQGRVSVLLRDVADEHYPTKSAYIDFEERPRWIEAQLAHHHALGVGVHHHRYYAYVDRQNRQWDCASIVDLLPRLSDSTVQQDVRRNLEDFWDFLPRANRGHLNTYGLLRYEDIHFMDKEGDVEYQMPHLFARFLAANGPFWRTRQDLVLRGEEIRLGEDWSKIAVFPKAYTRRIPGIRTSMQDIASEVMTEIRRGYQGGVLFAADERFASISVGDVLEVFAKDQRDTATLIQITFRCERAVGEYLDETRDFTARMSLRSHLGRDAELTERLTILEYRHTYRHLLEEEKR